QFDEVPTRSRPPKTKTRAAGEPAARAVARDLEPNETEPYEFEFLLVRVVEQDEDALHAAEAARRRRPEGTEVLVVVREERGRDHDVGAAVRVEVARGDAAEVRRVRRDRDGLLELRTARAGATVEEVDAAARRRDRDVLRDVEVGVEDAGVAPR